MINVQDIVKSFNSAESRWARFGPYYAMFPVDFAFNVIEKYSNEGDFIIDPFAGRCSSIYAGGILGRHSLGIEINPVGWLYGTVKLNPADEQDVIDRLFEIYKSRNYFSKSLDRMHLFYRMCYCDEVLKFLLAARKYLNWKNDNIDATLISILLVYLHGKLGEGLSNQMRKTKAMGMNYSIEWWKKNKYLKPPKINPLEFILKKIQWRYQKGKPDVFDSKVIFGDSTTQLNKIVQKSRETGIRFSLLFTSPPYCSVTNYHADQWLRLWLLGDHAPLEQGKGKYQGRFISKHEYYNLLDIVFGNCASIMEKKSTIYVRTDRREFTFKTTIKILKRHFPNHKVLIRDQPFKKRTQTEIHGNSSKEVGEVDIILTSEKCM